MSRRTSVAVAVAATLVAALGGLATTGVADAFGQPFPSVAFSAFEAAWKLWTAAVLVGTVWLTERRRIRSVDLGLVPSITQSERVRRARVALPASALALAMSCVLPTLIGDSSVDAGAYDISRDPSPLVVAIELLVRYPITVFVEEAFFRGWLFRVVPAAPVVTGILFGFFHLQQWTMIPALAAFGVALGFLRWWTGDIRLSSIVHYVGNATFFLGAVA